MVLPRAIVFGEALTDIVQGVPGQWQGFSGGAPWNVARALSRLSVSSSFAGAVSTDSLGDEIALQSEVAGLDMRFIQRVDREPLVAIVPSSRPPRYFFAGDADLFFDTGLLPQGWLDHTEVCHFGCISLARQPLGDRLVSLAEQVKRAGKRISFDPNWRNLMDRYYRESTFPTMTALADMIKLSDEDLRHLYPGLTEHQAMDELRALNFRAQILFTRGADGMILHTSDRQYEQPAILGDVADTVGAGDASMAGWLAADLLGITDLKERLRFSTACASLSCRHTGAYAPTLAEVKNLLTSLPSG
ncbi:carbohydrate kinase family protein [Pseudomonas reactans]|jgi:fructokinase|uniref:Carbohydrate kinase n=3 Tax=Pseudomonas TaxID=286 RepID=A0A7Y8KJ16_9PSED|nr:MULTISPECIES: carbohydrate kinase [Pseudomonas]ASV34923.1 carbohydrate kinase [Pseudomonas sp. NS1(2017)]KGE65809.1 sugar kinase [Pseudomonas fluorescens LMG 5329]NWA45754.1 carbohydrate kinase [Pseudomonas reactans]NWB30205.1 carbohydrate kinase [Pseudomonas gingeri]NWC36679.1 carbohydrate kinase [Pseudomonas gingeri]